MYHSHNEDSAESSESENAEDGYESYDMDFGNLQENIHGESENDTFPLHTRISERILRRNRLFEIDQTQPATSYTPMINGESSRWSRRNTFPYPLNRDRSSSIDFCSTPPFYQQARLSTTPTALSNNESSDSLSARGVRGINPLSTTLNGFTGDDDDNHGSPSLPVSEDHARRIHSTIFNRLENNLAELIRMREDAISFLEGGRSSDSSHVDMLPASTPRSEEGNETSERRNGENREIPSSRNREPLRPVAATGVLFIYEPLVIRERLSFQTRWPFESGAGGGRSFGLSAIPRRLDDQHEPFVMNKYTYTPIANFDNAPPAKPAKPQLEVGLTHCDEKAAAARKILDKLQFGDPEDEGACFVRRIWRETSVVPDSNSLVPALSAQLAGLAERTASLEATLEEMFDGLRLRLQRSRDRELEEEEDGQQSNESSSGNDENDEFSYTYQI